MTRRAFREETTATCRRCGGDFAYIRTNRHRFYCDGCKVEEVRESLVTSSRKHYEKVQRNRRP